MTTPSDELKRAAAHIREVAAAATPGRWETPKTGLVDNGRVFVAETITIGTADLGNGNRDHIALWQPTMAVLVADLLEDTARTFELLTVPDYAYEAIARELAIARAINGSQEQK